MALVTGGSSGIGLAVAKELVREGARVAICGRDAAKLEAAVAEIRAVADNSRVSSVAADVATSEGVDAIWAATADAFGGVDILINNAGTGSEETILEADDARWQYYWELHVMAAVRLTRHCARSMQERGGGVILNNASICAVQPLGYEPIYNVTKAALLMLGKCMANEFAKDGIRVNTINPGLVQTPDWVKTAKLLTKDSDQTWQDYLDNIARENTAIGRFADADEIAKFFAFLASPAASYCMGSSYFIDGGWLKVAN